MDDHASSQGPLEDLLLRDIAGHNSRLIVTRWIAGVGVLVAVAFCVRILKLPLAEGPLYLLGAAILTYNAGLAWLARHSYTSDYRRYGWRIRRLVLLQVALDWLSMAVFLHFTGGITSPAILFFFLHVLMVTILLPGQSPYIYVVLAVGMVGLIAVLEAGGTLPHYAVIPGLPSAIHANGIYVLAQVIFFAVTLVSLVYLVSSVMTRLRERERQIATLFQTAQDVSSTLELANVLERLARGAAQALAVPGASIRLLDPSGARLTMVASYGLSQTYLDKGPVELSQSELDRLALSGQPVLVAEATTDPRVQYPREMAEEGIHSILVMPIVGRRPLGVLRVYSEFPAFFNGEDAEFVMAIAHQGATAIENALAHDELQKSSDQRARFVHAVTHELRAPVTGAQSLLRVLLRDLVGELTPRQRDIMSRLERRLDALLDLINDLLDFAAVKVVDSRQPRVATSVQPVIQAVIERMSSQADEKAIALSCDLPDASAMVCATEDGLLRILGNLIGNAIKYTPEGGSVRVSLGTDANWATIVVTDTGIGIPGEVIERLGEEFFRASNAREAGIPGSGLGLTIVRETVDRFGGLLRVQSVVGKGSTFTVTLPLLGDEPCE